jgi:hypothetical protein
MPSDEDIAAAIMAAVLQRGAGKSVCPSEVARSLAQDWRPLMSDVRRVCAGLDGVVCTQKGLPVDPVTARGPIRLGLAS